MCTKKSEEKNRVKNKNVLKPKKRNLQNFGGSQYKIELKKRLKCMCLLGVERNVFLYNNSFLRLRFLGEAFLVSDKQTYTIFVIG